MVDSFAEARSHKIKSFDHDQNERFDLQRSKVATILYKVEIVILAFSYI